MVKSRFYRGPIPRDEQMLCGHHVSYMSQTDEGTCYCEECEATARTETASEDLAKAKEEGHADAVKDSQG